MDWGSFYQKVINYLNTYSSIWQTEVLEQYPVEEINPQLFELTNKIKHLDDSQLLDLENKRISQEISDFLKPIRDIESKIEIRDYNKENVKEVKPHLFKKMAKKKIHEVLSLDHFLKEFYDNENIVDFGGGVGHFCQHMARTLDTKSYCLDKEKSFLESGIKRIEKDFPELKEKITFKEVCISNEMHQNRFLQELSAQRNIYFGLHACGDLSCYLIDYFIKTKNSKLINFGCCYHKTQEDIFNLSNHSKLNPINWSKHALTLAARSNAWLEQEDLDKKRKVKYYRYGFHLYLYKVHGIKEFIALGFEGNKPYSTSLSRYINSNIEKLNLPIPFVEEDFEFDNEIKQEIEFLIKAGFIRSQFGRLIELAILLDRILYLEEAGKNVGLAEFFDKSLSPRNLGIVVR